MAYEMKPGEFQITSGDKAIGLKIQCDDGLVDVAVFPKTFDWGKVFSGNIKPMRILYARFIKFTVQAVWHYWNELESEQEGKPADTSKPTTTNEDRKSLLH